MKDTYSIKELQRETAAAVRSAESGALVTITRHDRPVVHVLSAERLSGILETMELLAEPGFMRQLKRLRSGKLKFQSAAAQLHDLKGALSTGVRVKSLKGFGRNRP